MSYISWLFRLFRRLFTESHILHRSARVLLWLFAILRDQIKRMKKSASCEPPTCDSSMSTIRNDLEQINNFCASTFPSVANPSIPPTVSIRALIPLPIHQSPSSQELAAPNVEEYDLGDMGGAMRALTLDPHVPLESDSISSGTLLNSSSGHLHIESALPAGDVPHNLDSRRVQPAKVVLEPIMPSSAMGQRYNNVGTAYVSRFSILELLTRSSSRKDVESKFVVEKFTKEFLLYLFSDSFDWYVYLPVIVVKIRRQIGYQSYIRRVLVTSAIGFGYVIILNVIDNLTTLQCCHFTKPILTNAYLCKDEVLKNINAAMDDILAKNFDRNEFEELVLDLISEKDEIKCGYYFVNHKSRTPVWLETFNISDHLEEVVGATSADHISMTLIFLLSTV